ncbi:MAG: class I SAM-dependent methyltransferase [Methanomassiliicoccales archaeon]|nr:class I SAM-dependent methyltransferase [Methanomassiliicoccales archaeon]
MSTPNPKQRDFFDEKAAEWDQKVRHDALKVERIVDLLSPCRGWRVLDVGTGTGVLIPFLLHRLGGEGSMMAVDYSENMLRVAAGKFPPSTYPNLEFLKADILTDELPDEYDAVICYSVFPHFMDQPRAVRRLSRCLRLGGLLMVAHSSSRETINGVHMEAGREVANDFLPPMPELLAMMRAAGMELVYSQDDEEYYIALARRVKA